MEWGHLLNHTKKRKRKKTKKKIYKKNADFYYNWYVTSVHQTLPMTAWSWTISLSAAHFKIIDTFERLPALVKFGVACISLDLDQLCPNLYGQCVG